jgi:hypothetical protein
MSVAKDESQRKREKGLVDSSARCSFWKSATSRAKPYLGKDYMTRVDRLSVQYLKIQRLLDCVCSFRDALGCRFAAAARLRREVAARLRLAEDFCSSREHCEATVGRNARLLLHVDFHAELRGEQLGCVRRAALASATAMSDPQRHRLLRGLLGRSSGRVVGGLLTSLRVFRRGLGLLLLWRHLHSEMMLID